MSWTETEKNAALHELAEYPAGAVWHGVKMERKERKLAMERAKRELKMARELAAGGAAKALKWMVRGYVGASVFVAVASVLSGIVGVQLEAARENLHADLVIPVAASVLDSAENDDRKKLNSATDFGNAPSIQFVTGAYRWSQMDSKNVKDLPRGFKDNLASCVRKGFCADVSTELRGLSTFARMPVYQLVMGRDVRVSAPAAAALLGAPQSIRLHSTQGAVGSLLGGTVVGLLVWLFVFGLSVWAGCQLSFTPNNLYKHWAPRMKAYAEKGLPSFEKAQMIKAVSIGRKTASVNSDGETSGESVATRKPSRI